MASLKGLGPVPEGIRHFIEKKTVEWDSCRLEELNGFKGKNWSKEEVIAKIAPEFRRYVDVNSLLGYLQSRANFVSGGNVKQIMHCSNPEEQCNLLLAHLVDLSSGSTDVVSTLLLSLMDSYEASQGGKSLYHHWIFAQTVLDTVLQCTNREMFNQPGVVETIEKLKVVECDQLQVAEFANTLGIHDQEFAGLGEVCDKWLATEGKEYTFAKLVRALVVTRGLGWLVTGLCPLSRCNPPDVRMWFNSLPLPNGWKKVAEYLGFTPEDIQVISNRYHYDQERIPQIFLRYLWIPDIGTEVDGMLESLGRVTGIEDVRESMKGVKQTLAMTGGAGIQVVPGRQPPVGEIVQQIHFSITAAPVQLFSSVAQQPMAAACTVPELITNVALVSRPQCSVLQDPNKQQDEAEESLATCDSVGLTDAKSSLQSSTTLMETNTQEQESYGTNECIPSAFDSVGTDCMKQALEVLDACHKGEWDLAKGLLESGGRAIECVDVCLDDGKTILHYACEGGVMELVETLVNYGADVSRLRQDGIGVLNYVRVIKNEELLKVLVLEFTRKNVPIDFNENVCTTTPLMLSCNEGDEFCGSAQLLLDSGASPNGSRRAFSRPLIVACERGYRRLVELLVGKGADLNAQDKNGNTALLEACRTKHFNIAQYLLEQPSININRSDKSGTTPLFVAISGNNYSFVEKLLDKGARIDAVRHISNEIMMGSVEQTPLAHACGQGFEKLVELLIDRGANVNFKCSDTVPPIGFAIIGRRMNIVKMLLKCNTLDTSVFGLSPSIIIAVKIGNFECANLLIDRLGGIEKALQLAVENQLEELTAHITMFTSNDQRVQEKEREWDPNSMRQNQGSFQMGFTQEQKDITLEQFSHLCINALKENEISKNVPLMDIAVAARAVSPENALFFEAVATDRHAKLDLRRDFLFGRPSPLTFLIGQRILTLDDFIAQAVKHFDGYPELFYENLVAAFQAIPRGEDLPGNIDGVLNRLFRGHFQINLSVGFADFPRGGGMSATSRCAGVSIPRSTQSDRDTAYSRVSSGASHFPQDNTPGSGYECVNRPRSNKSEPHVFPGDGQAVGHGSIPRQQDTLACPQHREPHTLESNGVEEPALNQSMVHSEITEQNASGQAHAESDSNVAVNYSLSHTNESKPAYTRVANQGEQHMTFVQQPRIASDVPHQKEPNVPQLQATMESITGTQSENISQLRSRMQGSISVVEYPEQYSPTYEPPMVYAYQEPSCMSHQDVRRQAQQGSEPGPELLPPSNRTPQEEPQTPTQEHQGKPYLQTTEHHPTRSQPSLSSKDTTVPTLPQHLSKTAADVRRLDFGDNRQDAQTIPPFHDLCPKTSVEGICVTVHKVAEKQPKFTSHVPLLERPFATERLQEPKFASNVPHPEEPSAGEGLPHLAFGGKHQDEQALQPFHDLGPETPVEDRDLWKESSITNNHHVQLGSSEPTTSNGSKSRVESVLTVTPGSEVKVIQPSPHNDVRSQPQRTVHKQPSKIPVPTYRSSPKLQPRLSVQNITPPVSKAASNFCSSQSPNSGLGPSLRTSGRVAHTCKQASDIKNAPMMHHVPYGRLKSAPGGREAERVKLKVRSRTEEKAEHKKVFEGRMELSQAPTQYMKLCTIRQLQVRNQYPFYTVEIRHGDTVIGQPNTYFRTAKSIPENLELIFECIMEEHPDLVECEIDVIVSAVYYPN